MKSLPPAGGNGFDFDNPVVSFAKRMQSVDLAKVMSGTLAESL
jgi:hypothetical protein